MTNLLAEVSVIFSDPSVLVVNKPAGLVVHADGRTEEPNLCDWILDNYPEVAGVGEPIERKEGADIKRPGIVHRLDRETSGALIIARTDEAHAHLKQQFKDRLVKKEYNAFVYGRLDEFRFTVDKPIGRSSGDFRQWRVPPHIRGKARAAHTDFQTVKSTDRATFLKAFPKTGRTHQIRVHLKSLHHPIVCDSLYAYGKECLFDFSRQALHARSITFTLPEGTTISAEADLPTDFQKAREELQKEV